MKTHWKKCFNKDYLGSHDLDEGKDLTAVIDHIEVRKVKDSSGGESNCNIAIFKGKLKPMILNVTNCKVIKNFSGSNYIEEWTDLPVTIYSREVKAFGEVMEALRIREKQPNMKKPDLTPEHPAWPNAIKYLAEPESTMDNIKKKYSITPEHEVKLQEAAI